MFKGVEAMMPQRFVITILSLAENYEPMISTISERVLKLFV